MRRYYVFGLLAVCHLSHSQDAAACGPTPNLLSPLLPEPIAGSVITNAVLIASNNYGAVAFTLRRMALTVEEDVNTTPQADAGAQDEAPLPPDPPNLTLRTTCYPASEGNLCIATPTEPLLPDAIYEWSVAATAEEGTEPPTPNEEWQIFITSDATPEPTPPTVNATVEEYVVNPEGSDPCGITSRVRLALTGVELTGPVVVNVKGVTPSYVMEPAVLSPGVPQAELVLYSPPECFTLELFDASGTRQELDEICPEVPQLPVHPVASGPDMPTAEPPNPDALPMDPSDGSALAPPRDSASSTTTEPSEPGDEQANARKRGITPRSNNGCSTAPGSKPVAHWALLGVGVAAAQLLRRRRPR